MNSKANKSSTWAKKTLVTLFVFGPLLLGGGTLFYFYYQGVIRTRVQWKEGKAQVRDFLFAGDQLEWIGPQRKKVILHEMEDPRSKLWTEGKKLFLVYDQRESQKRRTLSWTSPGQQPEIVKETPLPHSR